MKHFIATSEYSHQHYNVQYDKLIFIEKLFGFTFKQLKNHANNFFGQYILFWGSYMDQSFKKWINRS